MSLSPGPEILQSILNNVEEGLVAVDLDGNFVVWNRAATQILGLGPLPVVPAVWPEVYGLYCPDRKGLLAVEELPLFAALLHQREASREMVVRNAACPDGKWVNVRARPVYDAAGDFAGALALIVDVTNSRITDLSNQMMVGLFKSSQDAFVNVDPAGLVVSWNPGAEVIFGYTADEVLGRHVGLLAPPELLGELNQMIAKLNTGKEVRRNYTRGVRKDGSLIEVTRTVTLIRDHGGRLMGFSALISDITKWRQAERELIASQEQLRQLSARLQSAQEQELNRISRELHDELGQLLTGLKLDVAWLDDKLSRSQPDLLPHMADMNQLLEQTIQSVRRMATQMRPQLLEAMGLSAALSQLLEQTSKRAGFAFRLTVCREVQERLSQIGPERLTAIYRICQEGLTNISKHAQARNVEVEISGLDQELFIRISDDGKGLELSELARTKGLGMVGMRERAHLWSGKLELESVQGAGLSLRVTFPWEHILRPDTIPLA